MFALGNIYAVMLSEMVSNIFKEGMWFKALGPYMLIITNASWPHDVGLGTPEMDPGKWM